MRQEEEEAEVDQKESDGERLSMAVLKMSSYLKYACNPETILLAKAKDGTKSEACSQLG